MRGARLHIEHELPERAFHLTTPTFSTTKRAPESFAAASKSILPERLAKFEMLLRRKRVIPFWAPK